MLEMASGPGAVAVGALALLGFVTSALTASAGAGGGLLMLAVLANVLPPAALIPVHGLVQLGSNGGRALLARHHVDLRFTGILLAGAVAGTAAGALVLQDLPADALQVTVAGFILWLAWSPPAAPRATGPAATAGFGALAGFLSLFVGATGPLVGAWVQRLERHRLTVVATMAACMTGLNAGKLVVFGVAGFEWLRWLPACAAMIAGGLAGTWCGLRLLGKLPEARFRQVFRLVLSALALVAGWQGLRGLTG